MAVLSKLCSEGAGGGVFQLFPVLVWEKILEKIESPHDALALMITDTEFEEEFHHKKQNWQFPVVLGILIKNLDFRTGRSGAANADATDSFKKDLQIAIRNCRLVSRFCLNEVDKCVEEHWNEQYSPPPFLPSSAILENIRFSLPPDEAIQRFLQDATAAEEEERSLLLSRYLEFDVPPFFLHQQEMDDEEEEEAEALRLLLQLLHRQKADLMLTILENVGGHLRGMKLFLESMNIMQMDHHHHHIYNGDGTQIRRLIRRMLELAPNLKSLTFEAPFRFDFESSSSSSQAETVLPLPPSLPNLQHLSVIDSSSVELGPRLDYSAVLNLFDFRAYFPLLKKLEMTLDIWKEEYNNVEGLFRNLQDLSLFTENYKDSIALAGKKTVGLLENLDAPKLRKLRWHKKVQINRDSMVGWYEVIQLKEARDAVLNVLEKKHFESEWKCEMPNKGYDGILKFYKIGESSSISSNSELEEEFTPNTGTGSGSDDVRVRVCDAEKSTLLSYGSYFVSCASAAITRFISYFY